ncbi:mortality factor 4-like protein 1 isoform X2 [Physella acuta]|uniref:mortality factor 4-like protein 1 isoform X2 n=1 Tax=Physella acuta TaxID=109671 RepID=UPI0027DADDEB|nr:mortality factor 4-like protein 1 isoform X2 [Physella acuta]
MAPKPKFQEGEKVLCYHGPLLYEAKCMRMEVKEGKVQYLIHYNGWNKNWDEWVQESRVVKNNEAGIQKQKELLKNHGAQTKKNKAAKKLEKDATKAKTLTPGGKEKEKDKDKSASKDKESSKEGKEKDKSVGEKTPKEKSTPKEKKEKDKEPRQRPSTPQLSTGDKKKDKEVDKEAKDKKESKEKISETIPSAQSTPVVSQDTSLSSQTNTSAGEPKRKRARLDPTVETEETYLSKIEVKIKIPEDIKPVLVDDWDLITRQKMLVTLPCKQTVDDIIDDYIKTKTSKSTNINKDAMAETMLGCKDYFNVMLGSQLLYKFERPQYSEILSEFPDKPMSSIYGAIHLLRLFVRLGNMLAFTSLDERTVHILLNYIHDFLKYLSKNGAALFKISNYEIAPPDYHRKAI